MTGCGPAPSKAEMSKFLASNIIVPKASTSTPTSAMSTIANEHATASNAKAHLDSYNPYESNHKKPDQPKHLALGGSTRPDHSANPNKSPFASRDSQDFSDYPLASPFIPEMADITGYPASFDDEQYWSNNMNDSNPYSHSPSDGFVDDSNIDPRLLGLGQPQGGNDNVDDDPSNPVTCQSCQDLKTQIQIQAEKYELLEEQEGEISKNLKDSESHNKKLLAEGQAEIDRRVKVEKVAFEKRRQSIKEYYESEKETDIKLHQQRMEEQKARYGGEIQQLQSTINSNNAEYNNHIASLQSKSADEATSIASLESRLSQEQSDRNAEKIAAQQIINDLQSVRDAEKIAAQQTINDLQSVRDAEKIAAQQAINDLQSVRDAEKIAAQQTINDLQSNRNAEKIAAQQTINDLQSEKDLCIQQLKLAIEQTSLESETTIAVGYYIPASAKRILALEQEIQILKKSNNSKVADAQVQVDIPTIDDSDSKQQDQEVVKLQNELIAKDAEIAKLQLKAEKAEVKAQEIREKQSKESGRLQSEIQESKRKLVDQQGSIESKDTLFATNRKVMDSMNETIVANVKEIESKDEIIQNHEKAMHSMERTIKDLRSEAQTLRRTMEKLVKIPETEPFATPASRVEERSTGYANMRRRVDEDLTAKGNMPPTLAEWERQKSLAPAAPPAPVASSAPETPVQEAKKKKTRRGLRRKNKVELPNLVRQSLALLGTLLAFLWLLLSYHVFVVVISAYQMDQQESSPLLCGTVIPSVTGPIVPGPALVPTAVRLATFPEPTIPRTVVSFSEASPVNASDSVHESNLVSWLSSVFGVKTLGWLRRSGRD
jgi:hypothetical protein